jgi:hypothetical protein
MLRELQRLHAELLAGIGRLEALVLDPRPDAETVARVRTDLARTSLTRFEFLEQRVFPALPADLPAHYAARLENLKSTTPMLRTESEQHIAAWSADAAAKDWRGYQRASSGRRRSMRARIAEEMAVLYPLLQKLEED